MAHNDSQKSRMEDWMEKGELVHTDDEAVLHVGFIITQQCWGQQTVHVLLMDPKNKGHVMQCRSRDGKRQKQEEAWKEAYTVSSPGIYSEKS